MEESGPDLGGTIYTSRGAKLGAHLEGHIQCRRIRAPLDRVQHAFAPRHVYITVVKKSRSRLVSVVQAPEVILDSAPPPM